jgi:Tol biopolymer transport system component
MVAIPSATSTGGGRDLAFVSERSGKPQIWLVNIDSGDLTQLTDMNDGACQPDWSPEGDRIVFTSPCTGHRLQYPKSSLHILYLENGDIQPLPASLEGDFDPAWSPNGEEIVYTTLLENQRQLAKIELENYGITVLSDGKTHDFHPAWSPDGSELVFIRSRGYDQVWTMKADGSDPEQFSYSGLISNSNPVWYGDKGLILFSQELGVGSPSKKLRGMRIVAIGEPREYTIEPENFKDYIPLLDHVDISPDGLWLTFDLWYFDVLSDIYIMTFPGANLQQVTDHPGEDYDPAWRP